MKQKTFFTQAQDIKTLPLFSGVGVKIELVKFEQVLVAKQRCLFGRKTVSQMRQEMQNGG